MARHDTNCWNCNHPIKFDAICYDDSVPAKELCKECFDSSYCKCGRKAFENGMCIDCSSENEIKQEANNE